MGWSAPRRVELVGREEEVVVGVVVGAVLAVVVDGHVHVVVILDPARQRGQRL